MKQPVFHGSGVALVTPMHGNDIDWRALDALIDWQLAEGTDALIMCGTTGEPSTLTDGEQERVLARALERADGRVPVIAGTGGNNTAHVIAMARRARALGASAQLCVTPYYNKTTQRGLIAHYTAVADATDLPVILYNVPARTGLDMLPETVAALAGHENIVALKEATGNPERAAAVLALCGLALYSGSDEVNAQLLALGAQGVISVVANVLPRRMHALSVAGAQTALAMQEELAPLTAALFSQVSPIPVKAALAMMGRCREDVRLPLVPMDDAPRKALREQLQKLHLI